MTEHKKQLQTSAAAALAAAVSMGSGVRRVTSDSESGKKMASAAGSILADDEERYRQVAIAFKEKTKHNGSKEIARRKRQIERGILAR